MTIIDEPRVKAALDDLRSLISDDEMTDLMAKVMVQNVEEVYKTDPQLKQSKPDSPYMMGFKRGTHVGLNIAIDILVARGVIKGV